MIKSVLIVNNHGKPRLVKFYERMPEDKQQHAVRDVFNLVQKRGERLCNFIEGGSVWGDATKIIYRHYATLYFVFVVDDSESELGILDLIQVFVEVLDDSFESVCELDIIFHSDRVHHILDEIVMGGMVLETNHQEITQSIAAQKACAQEESVLPIDKLKEITAQDLSPANLLNKIRNI